MVPPGATPGFLDYQGNLIMEAHNQREREPQSQLCFARYIFNLKNQMIL